MNLQQLRIIREAVRRDYNLTAVATVLFTSQSGVSKHIKDLEEELGVDIFVRRGKRLTGLTPPGRELVEIVDRILMDSRNIKQLAEQFANSEKGQLTVATTHTQARYALPSVVTRFRQTYPNVHLALHQGSPREIVAMLKSGDADIGVATEALEEESVLRTFPYYSWRHAIVVSREHPLTLLPSVTLSDLAAYPIITYHDGFTGRARIDETFAKAHLSPDIVMTALDADVIKTYVELGLGVGIIAEIAYQPERDVGLAALTAPREFRTNTTLLAVREGQYLRGFAYRFIELCSATLSEAVVRSALAPKVQTVSGIANLNRNGLVTVTPGATVSRRNG
jgi:LysR family transcriptional regulator, cys regulon transcriptional activator